MVRLNIIVEGHTEETFVRDMLSPHLAMHGVYVGGVRRVETGRKRGKIYRGGITSYSKAKKDIQIWMKQEKDAWFSTMFDLYALPKDFPGMSMSKNIAEPYEKIETIEKAFANDIGSKRFIPYIQLHEFEALLFSNIIKMGIYFLNREKEIKELKKLCDSFVSPEHINDTPDTAPSKRIERTIPGYHHEKPIAGPLVSAAIGFTTIRAKCHHFNKWISYLESLV